MTATVRIQNVSHSFGSTRALTNIDLTIEAGRFAVLLGPSGCGKTTLLSVLGGFITPDSGSILLDDSDVTNVAPAMRATTTMFQDYALFPHMSLQDNVGFGLRMRRVPKPDRHAKAQQLLSLVGLDDSFNRKPHELSGGQRQRVALARALAVEPDVLLLDEPLGALDLKLRRQMQDELKAIQKRVGTTFVHVTHDQEEAMAIADDIVVMNEGRIEDSGAPETIYLKPRSMFSAAFMGEANMIDASVLNMNADSMKIDTEYGKFELPLQTDINQCISAGDPVVLSFRPEHVVTEKLADMSVIDLGKAVVIDHAFFGTHLRCQLKTENAQTLTVHLPQDTAVVNGETIDLQIRRSSLIVLPNNGNSDKNSDASKQVHK